MNVDVIGIAMTDDISTLATASVAPGKQKLKVWQGVDLTVRCYVKSNGQNPVDITNWAFEMSIQLQQPQNPSQAAPTPPKTLKRQGVITQVLTPYGGIVEFYFQASETSQWLDTETDQYDIYGTAPATGTFPNGVAFALVPTSIFVIEKATTVFPAPTTPTPVPPIPFTMLANWPIGSLPDPRFYPLGAVIVAVDVGPTYKLRYNPLGTAWVPFTAG